MAAAVRHDERDRRARAEHGLLGLGRQRPDAGRRLDLADRLQRRRPARRGDARGQADPPARSRCSRWRWPIRCACGSAPASRSPCSRSSCSRSSSAPPPRARSCRRWTTSRRTAAASTSPPRSRRRARSATPRAAVQREVPSTFRVVASETVLSAKMAQAGDRRRVTYPLRGFDDSFLNTTTYGLAARARGYDSSRDVWQALSRRPDLAVIDALAAPRRDNWGFGVAARTAVARLLHRGRHVRPGARRRPRSAHRQHPHGDGHRRALRHGADREDRAVDLASRRR